MQEAPFRTAPVRAQARDPEIGADHALDVHFNAEDVEQVVQFRLQRYRGLHVCVAGPEASLPRF